MIKGKDEVPGYASLIGITDFKDCVRCGGFTDYDGFGYYSDGIHMFEIVDLGTVNRHRKYKYVAWFNR